MSSCWVFCSVTDLVSKSVLKNKAYCIDLSFESQIMKSNVRTYLGMLEGSVEMKR